MTYIPYQKAIHTYSSLLHTTTHFLHVGEYTIYTRKISKLKHKTAIKHIKYTNEAQDITINTNKKQIQHKYKQTLDNHANQRG